MSVPDPSAATGKMRVAQVAVNAALDRIYDYEISLHQTMSLGTIVLVPLGSRQVKGVVVGLLAHSDFPDLKPIHEILGQVPDDLYRLACFLHTYYHAPIGLCMSLMCPPEAKRLLKTKDKALAPFSEWTLTPKQTKVVERLVEKTNYAVTVLHGVTGSGKTEVALEVANRIITAGKQALMLVPEINLTPQWLARIESRLPGLKIAVLHSRLSEGERYRAHRMAASGEADLVLGTRLAIFTPLPRLGLIVIDEEHDSAYKQGETPRYHARDIAVMRAQVRQVPLLLASATPSFESLANVKRGRYHYQSLTERIGNAVMPSILLAPSKALSPVQGIGHQLYTALNDRLNKGEQSLLFFNRRGYAPRLVCGSCHWHGECPHCDAAMIFHRIGQRLHCHRCDFKIPLPRRCPACDSEPLVPMGSGTQQLEEQVRLGFPQARIARVDLDSTRNKEAWPTLRAQILNREIDIILGTQMVVKGHDFPALSLVGVLGADDALFGIDFRAGERIYAQLTQVAGRAGRGDIAGEVIIQTDFPHHPVYQAIVQNQGAEYVANSMAERAAHGWPPDTHLALIRVETFAPDLARKTLHALWQQLSEGEEHQALVIYPPVPSPLAKIAKYHRWQMLLSSSARTVLHQRLDECQTYLSEVVKRPNRFIIDVDPVDTF